MNSYQQPKMVGYIGSSGGASIMSTLNTHSSYCQMKIDERNVAVRESQRTVAECANGLQPEKPHQRHFKKRCKSSNRR